jgi:hypothetical protein
VFVAGYGSAPSEPPGIATSIVVPPLPAGEAGDGGEWDLLRSKVSTWFDGADLQGRWESLGGPLRAGGLLLAAVSGYIVQALTMQAPFIAIGLGMWIALVMAFNVWFIIWPNQKKALGMVTVTPEEKTKAGRLAMLTSRANTLLSIAMLYLMVAQQNAGL